MNNNQDNKPIFISLGEFCAPAQVVESLNLRTGSYPFDWLYSSQTENLKFILEMIENESIDSVYKKYITFVSKDHENFDRNELYYAFPHEKDVFSEEFKEKSRRRIQRLYDAIQQEKITFLFSNRNDVLDGSLFVSFIEKVNQVNKDIKCIVFHGDSSLQCNHPNLYLAYYPFPKCPNNELAHQDSLYKDWMKQQLQLDFI